MRPRPGRRQSPPRPAAPLPAVLEECETDEHVDASEVEIECEEERQSPVLTRQLGLPPVQRQPLHWRVVRPEDGLTAEGATTTTTTSGSRRGSPSPARCSSACSVSSSLYGEGSSRGCAAAGAVPRARNHGDGVLSSFAAAPSGVPRQVNVGLFARRGHHHRSSPAGDSASAAEDGTGSTVRTGSSSRMTASTLSSLRSAPSLGGVGSSSSSASGSGNSDSSSSFIEAVTRKAVSFRGASSGKRASTLPHHRRQRKGGAFERAFLSDRHRNRTLLVLSAAAIVGASLSVLTLPSAKKPGKSSSTSVGLARALRERRNSLKTKISDGIDGMRSDSGSGRSLFSLESHHVDRYPFTNFADTSRRVLDAKREVSFYWQVPRSGGTTFKHVLGSCLDLVQASRTARDYCDMEKDGLELCETKFGRFVNVDPSDDPGIKRGRELDVVRSGMVDVVVSSRFLHSAGLFDTDGGGTSGRGGNSNSNKKKSEEQGMGMGRAFTVLRHPVQRSLSTFRYLQNAHWERNYNPEFKSLTVAQWAARTDTARDWMVRWLTGKNHEGDLERSDLEFAKEVLRRKFLILLTDDLVVGVDRLVRYMGWDTTNEQRKCAKGAAVKAAAQNRGSDAGGAVQQQVEDHIGDDTTNEPSLEPGTEEYEALASINKLDIELYEYARELYKRQWDEIFMGGKALKIRGDDDSDGDATAGDAAAEAAAASVAEAFEKGKINSGNADANAKAKMAEMMNTEKALAAAAAAAAAAEKKEEKPQLPEIDKDSLPLPPAMAALASKFGPVDEEDAEKEKGPAKVDKESLPLPPAMAALAAQFDPIDDMDLEIVDKKEDDNKKTTDDKGRADPQEQQEEGQSSDPPQGEDDHQDPEQQQQEEDQDVVPAAAAAVDGRKDELPVPPEMARLAAAFGGDGGVPEEKSFPAAEDAATAQDDGDDLMSSEDDGKNGAAAAAAAAREALPVPPAMAELAAAFEK